MLWTNETLDAHLEDTLKNIPVDFLNRKLMVSFRKRQSNEACFHRNNYQKLRTKFCLISQKAL